MNGTVRATLLALRVRDEQVRAELAADGSLFDGYHARMEEVHRANAQVLRDLIDAHGWPDEALAGTDGAEAAWLVAQHAIGEPDFMRRCRTLLDAASASGRVPRWQFAYIDDRINVFEGRPQRFGTQIDLRPDGPRPHPLEDPSRVDLRRREVGLSDLADVLAKGSADPRPSPDEYAAKQAAGQRWARAAGWPTASGGA